MKQVIEVYLHGSGTTEEKLVSVPEDSTVQDLIDAAKRVGFPDIPDLILVLEEEEEPLVPSARLRDCGVKNKHHLSCHTCRKIAVTVNFNGSAKERKFAPSRKVKGVLKWALSEFGLTGADAENKELRLGGTQGTVLQSQQHIGSFVNGSCDLLLFLTAVVEVNG